MLLPLSKLLISALNVELALPFSIPSFLLVFAVLFSKEIRLFWQIKLVSELTSAGV